MSSVVILGAGHAGGVCAALLRQYGFSGGITLIGEEPIPPYQRPPLSKAWVKGEATAEDLALKPLSFYAEQGIDFRAGVTALALDCQAKTVALDDGEAVSFDTLVIATGARAIALPIPGSDLKGVMSLRTAADAERLKAAIGHGKTLAVVGGGYIGLEVAASGRALGAEVVVIEREERLLARVADPTLSGFLKAYHEARGVHFELGCHVVSFEPCAGPVSGVRIGEHLLGVADVDRVAGVRLSDGRIVHCDLVVVGVGAQPNDEIAREAGLAFSHGVVVDREARTSHPAVFAIGDVTHRPMPLYGRMFRPESVPSALEQAKQAACAITGRPAPAPEVPWNWSDQYDIKLQIAGLPFDVDEVVLRGDPATARFAVFHLKGDHVQSVEAINSPSEFMMGKQLIASRRAVDKSKLRDPAVPMKEVVA